MEKLEIYCVGNSEERNYCFGAFFAEEDAKEAFEISQGCEPDVIINVNDVVDGDDYHIEVIEHPWKF